MAFIDIDLDDFPTYEILSELRYRLKNSRDKEQIITGVRDALKIEVLQNKKPLSMVDNMKIDFLLENIDKITLEALEGLISK